MISKEELQQLLLTTETYRVERTISTNNMDKFCEAICAFSNDMFNCEGSLLITRLKENNNSKAQLIQDEILKFCTSPRSMQKIADFLGLSNKRKVRERYVNPLLGKSLNMTIPDKPTSRLQKYISIQ